MSRTLLSASSALLIDRIFRAGIGLLAGIAIARHYGPAEFGQLSYVLLAASLFGGLATLGLDEMGPRDMAAMPHSHLSREDMLKTILRMRSIGGLLAYVLLVLFVYLELGVGVTLWIALILGLYLPLQSADAFEYRFRVEGKFLLIALTRSFSALCSSTIKILSVFLGWPIYMIAAAMTGEYASNGFIFSRINRAQFGIGAEFNLPYAKLLLSRSWKIMLAGVMIALQVRIEYYLIEKMMSWSDVGQYSAALKIFEILDVVPIIFSLILMPQLASSLHGAPEEKLKQSFQGSYLSGLLIYLALIPVMLIIIWAFPLAFGEQYLAAQALLPLLMIRPLFGMFNAIRGVYVILEHRYFFPLLSASIGLLLSFSAAYLLIPAYGLYGAVIANLLGLLGSTILADLLFYRKSTIALITCFQQSHSLIEKLRSFQITAK
ncbi:oligosaccharide flippase family protein [Polynucleobacter sp. Tro8-14-1]|uniref:oligosaccharide flippase family protein n=1 Tax=Polynucleobacter sp. Tro8-14-1 TaxID=1758383 RepID=UPI001C0D07A2|nr:oligosaccharide flippase family protein [Polynucleobacter sp. Tro8-14-1]MBU3563610.1 oligosaccharide flippase family protein [Polynucleobacter sp. Tro8-14-1]